MTITSKFGMQLPAAEDYYDISQYNDNLQKLDSGAVLGIGVASIRVMTAEAYAALTEPDGAALYIVTDSSTIKLYLGALPMAGGGSTAVNVTAVAAAALAGAELEAISGTMTEITETEEA